MIFKCNNYAVRLPKQAAQKKSLRANAEGSDLKTK